MNLLERAELRKETFYKLTNSGDVPTAPSVNRNLLSNSKAFSGSNITGSSTVSSETYEGCTVRYFKNTNPNSARQDLIQFNNCVYPKLGGEYVASFWAKGSGELSIFFYGNTNYLQVASCVTSWGASTSSYDGYITLNLTSDWQRYWIKYKLKTAPASATSVGKHLLFRHNNNSTEDEIYLSGCKLEEGNIASDYSQAPEDLGWSTAALVPTQQQRYLWKFEYIYYSDDSVEVTQPVNLSIAGADADTAGVTAAISEIDSKANSLRADLTNVSNSLSNAASQLQAQAAAQADLTSRVSTVEETANGTKTTVTELAKTVDDNTDDITSITQQTSAIETDLSGTKATLSQVQTTANTTKANLATYQASNDQAVVSLQSSLQTTNGNVSSLQTQVAAVPGQITSAVSAVEGKIPTKIGAVNLLKNTKSFNGTNITGVSTLLSETYQGCAVRYFKNDNPNSNYQDFAQYLMCVVPNSESEYVVSFWAKGSGTTRVFFYNGLSVDSFVTNQGISESRGDGRATFTLSENWERYWVKYKLRATTEQQTVAKNLLFRHDNNSTEDEIYLAGVQLEEGNVVSGYAPNPDDYAAALATAKSEIKQTTDAITASVSSVEAKANTAQSTANTAVSKADAAQAGVNTLDSTTVKTATLNLDNNGFVTKVGKTIDGNKFATMIAQDANSVKIIADEMQVTADMIVDGAVTAEKLDVNNLSAVNSNLGAIKGGSLLLQENKAASSSVDNWGTFNRPAHKQGLYMDNHGLASSGAIQRKNASETTPTDMPLAVLQSGELRFLVVDYNDNLENVLNYGLSDPDYGAIRFEIDSELKRRLTMTSSGYLNFQASNYTDWIPLSQQGCEYMIQGRLVAVNYDVTYSQSGTHKIGDIPQEFVKKELMLTAKAWSITPNDKNFQLNADGGLHLLNADANVTYRGTLLFSY